MAILQTKIRTGIIQGIETEAAGITAFLGIPYAKAPKGDLRWRAPEPAGGWEGVRSCKDFGFSCWQADNSESPYFKRCMELNPVKPRPLRMNEDCLSLNVWTPASDCGQRLPVMVWFYGGGLQGGTSDDILFDGEGLCRYGVVLVTVNYRTGVFGYFGHSDLEKENPNHSSGNYGLQDQLLSLHWVHDNITAFGGDPDNVTIFGCSGGGRSVQGIACSPLSKGLVRHAICQSAGGLNPNYSLEYRSLKQMGQRFLAFCGKETIEQMRSIPAQELQRLYLAFGEQFNITDDGYALPVEMDEMVRRGDQADIDYILITTANEIRWPVKEKVTLSNFYSHKFGIRTAIFGATCHPATDEDAMRYAEWAEVYEMKAAQLAWAKVQAAQPKKPVYLASFDHPMPGTGLASHGDDQYYVFHTLRKYWFPSTAEDEALSQTMMRYWTNFAKTGDPNGEDLVEWTPYTPESPRTLSIQDADACQMQERRVREIEKLANVYITWSAEHGEHGMEKIETKVIIVGSGAAGMMAALTLADAGISSIILEKGGSIAVSNGARAGGPSLAGTRLQQAEGCTVSPEQLFGHMFHFSRGTVNAGLLRNAVSHGPVIEDFFSRNGVGAVLLPDTYGVGFRARSLFACHGTKRWKPLADDLISKGGEIHLNRTAQKLILENGRVAGVYASNSKDPDALFEYRADFTVLATGGYLGSRQMLREHFGDCSVIPLGNRLSDGGGITMALEAGGILDRNWGICSNEFGGANAKMSGLSSNALYAICGGLLVDNTGLRFMNEQLLSDEPLSIGGELALRAGTFYAVLDDDMYQAMLRGTPYEYYGKPEMWSVGKQTLHHTERLCKPGDLAKDIQKGWAVKADCLEEAAAAFSLPCLKETVNRYNEMCQTGADTQFGKSAYLLKTLRRPPYYVFQYQPSAWCTLGGVKTDAYCRLLDRGGKVIDGVYVAGIDNGSCFCVPYYDNEGAALGLSLGMGVTAGKHIADMFRKE